MYINQIQIHNICSIQSLSWDIRNFKCAGWHVIIGDNGSGKSSLLRSLDFLEIDLIDTFYFLPRYSLDSKGCQRADYTIEVLRFCRELKELFDLAPEALTW